ncbi:MAG: GNAT family N-acetyltransferase, partial [Candidatus Heimdallarchaeota archaeon]|nr:GNAT family N-acetyltransferase [Candidatus Heimdallarchaeota archaeon]MCK4609687.1 GNAT family N-acetyltransferase [Candidatus Heimdallarchaeota archaeon]
MMIREFKDTEDINQAVKLAVLCFHEPAKEMEKFFAGIQELKMLGAFEENTLLAAAGSYKFQMFIREKLFDCAGIAYVMTNPVQRRKGYV